jgi:hypothetical protein
MGLGNLKRANLVWKVMRNWSYYKTCFEDNRLDKKKQKHAKSLSNQCLQSLVEDGLPCGK